VALKIAQDYKYVGQDYWKWSVWLEGPARELDRVASVTYTLHPTFIRPVRTIDSREHKFRLKTSGWGTFTIYAQVNRKDGSIRKLKHNLVLLYPDGTPTDA
jgi:transcription initiation factor IIF auxiliary subunit